MLSILIPIYNYDVRNLIKELQRQAREQYIDFEILAYEDGSTHFLEENAQLTMLANCIYKQNSKNIGRAAIRNQLADDARYGHLLFLDCDAEIVSSHFVEKYLSFLKEDTIVLGGRVYTNLAEPDYSLLKKYGSKRERNDLHNLENKASYPMFTTPNFLIPKSVFTKVRFDEKIDGYGHEDSIFGIELKRRGFDYIFIDNPVVHIGLEKNDVFLKKTHQALDNLLRIYQSKKYQELEEESKILKTYLKIKSFRKIFSFLYKTLHQSLTINLLSEKPNLLLFDLYKLLYFCYIAGQK